MCTILLVLPAGGAHAHRLKPEQVVAQLQADHVRRAYAITSVTRDSALPRLLVIRVGRGWQDVPRRDAVAEQWLRLWREAVHDGIVAVLDDASDQPLVNFDARGNAVLKNGQAAPAPTPSRPSTP